jgi:hypothetical protein
MKRKYELTALMFGMVLALISFSSPASAQYGEEVSLETFYEELSPYGVWIDDPQYGKVWRPDVDQDEFRPYYTNGHWEMTKYGNTWVSNYDWGWAPFHYGRWHHHSRRGWVWIPGREWSPAWVSWRSGGGHYGWAPLGPGININVNIGRIPSFWWVFIPQRHIYYRSYPRYDYRRYGNIYNNTVIINNTYVYNNRNRYYTGPRAEEIRRVTRQPVIVHEVRNQGPNRYANGRDNRPEVYRGTEPRPARANDNSRGIIDRTDRTIADRSNDSRGAVNGRPDRTVTARPADNSLNRGAIPERPDRVYTRPSNPRDDSRTEGQKLPASSQRSARTYDNQSIEGNPSAQRQRREVAERQPQQVNRPSAPQREQRVERPQQQRQVSRDNGGQRSQGSSVERSASSGRSSERSAAGGRPSRSQ